jgi:hypothetical protein
MVNISAFLKLPVEFHGKCLIYPPSVNEVVRNKDALFYARLLSTSQEEIEDMYREKGIEEEPMTPLEHLLGSAYRSPKMAEKIKKAFYFFLREPVQFLYEEKAIVVGDIKETLKITNDIGKLRIIKEDEFFDFQNSIRAAMGEKEIEPPDPDEDPRVKRIKAKARYRDKIKAKKGMGLKLNSTLISICCMGLGLNPLNIGEISYASIPALVRYYQEKDKYKTDVQSLLAGADSKKVKPKYWIRNIED